MIFDRATRQNIIRVVALPKVIGLFPFLPPQAAPPGRSRQGGFGMSLMQQK